MGNSLADVRKRISSTKSTAQITKAMNMVSSSKVKKAERTYKGYKDFMKNIEDLVKGVLSIADEEYIHPLMQLRKISKVAYLVITSDKGLAGAYNSSVLKKLDELVLNNKNESVAYYCQAIGKKGYSHIKKRKYDMLEDSLVSVRDDVSFLDIEQISNDIIEGYINGKIDKLVVIYNHFVNNISYSTEVKQILPIMDIEGEYPSIDYVYEDGVEKTLDLILPMYIKDVIYGIMLDAKCTEHSARMNSMKNATDNANEIISKLQLLYNRARQNEITTELIDIIGGANAIGGE